MTDQEWMDYRLEEAVWRPDRESCLQFSLIKSTPGGFLAEFGFGRGESLNFLADLTDETVHGFEALQPQIALGSSSRALSSQGADRHELRFAFNACLWPGSLCETLPLFLDEVRSSARFVHINSHHYRSTHEVLLGLEARIVRGTVVQFEWLWSYPNWEEGAFRALQEFAGTTDKSFRFLARTSGAQVTVMFR